MSSKLADQPATLAELFSKCSQLAANEEKQVAKIVGTMLPVLGYLDSPVELRPASLGEPLRGLKSVSLQKDAAVVITNQEGKVLSRPLGKFRAEERLAILRGAIPELQRLVADKRRATHIKPALSVRIVLDGAHFIVDRRSYRVEISNSGGDCKGLVVSSQLPDVRSKPSRPRDVSLGETVEVDLGIYKEITEKGSIQLVLDCKDMDGRLLSGEQSLKLDGSPQDALLSWKKSQTPGSRAATPPPS